MEPSTRTLAPITSTNEAKASMSTASSTASRTSDSPSKSPLWRLPPDVLTNLQPSYWTRRSSHGPPDGGPTRAAPPVDFVLGHSWSPRKRHVNPSLPLPQAASVSHEERNPVIASLTTERAGWAGTTHGTHC